MRKLISAFGPSGHAPRYTRRDAASCATSIDSARPRSDLSLSEGQRPRCDLAQKTHPQAALRFHTVVSKTRQSQSRLPDTWQGLELVDRCAVALPQRK